MEHDDIEMCRLRVRKVVQDVLKFAWFKQGVIPEKPKPELSFVPEVTAEFINNLSIFVWIEPSRIQYIWEDFLRNHFKRMSMTPYLFARYFAYAGYILTEKTTNIQACFLDILILVTHFSLHCWQNEDKRFLNSCVDLFCAFFDMELCIKFEDQGRWKNFNEYLENQESLKRYKELESANQNVIVLFNEFQSRHLQSKEPYVVNDLVIRNITESCVEHHKNALSFAELVGDKMKKVCDKSFEEVLKDFQKTDSQVEELYRKTIGEASGDVASSEDQPSSQEDSFENVPCKTYLKDKNRSNKVEFETVIEPSESLDLSTAPQKLDLDRKSTKIKRAKALLKEMLADIEKITELIKFICEENVIKVPIQVMETSFNL